MLQTDLSPTLPALPPPATLHPAARFDVFAAGTPGRDSLEARIHSGYGEHFGACIRGYMPRLARYTHSDGAAAIIGLRKASEGPLFLETYLPDTVENIVSAVSGTNAERASIVEVGQFVVDDRRIVAGFFRDLVPFLIEDGCRWVCFTGTNRVRAILERAGLRGMPIGTGSADLVTSADDHWGDYYENEPVVILGRLDDPSGRWCRRGHPAATATDTVRS